MGGESEAAWRALLDDLVNRGLKTPDLVIVDGALLAGCFDPTLHGSQTSQSSCPCVAATTRGNIGGLQGYDLRRHEAGGRGEAQSLHPKMAPEMPSGRCQPGGGKR